MSFQANKTLRRRGVRKVPISSTVGKSIGGLAAPIKSAKLPKFKPAKLPKMKSFKF